MSVENKIEYLIEEAVVSLEEAKKWSQKVKEKWHPREGLFRSGSAEEIASEVSEHGKASLKTAMARINFYMNRAGKNLPDNEKGRLNRAKEILDKRYGKTS